MQIKIYLPYLDDDESCAVNGKGPDDGCLVDTDIPLDETRLVAVLGVLDILKEGTVLAGVDLISLKMELIFQIVFGTNCKNAK